MGADVAFTGVITLLHFKLAFSKAKYSINIYLTSESYIILVIAEVNLCKKILVKDYLGLRIILKTGSVLFLDSSILSQASKLL